jgi:hypothetical protein
VSPGREHEALQPEGDLRFKRGPRCDILLAVKYDTRLGEG